MDKCLIKKSSIEIEYGIETIIERYLWIRNILNNTNAYTDQETKERIELIQERKFLEKYLKIIGIQDFELKNEYIIFKIL